MRQDALTWLALVLAVVNVALAVWQLRKMDEVLAARSPNPMESGGIWI